MSETKAMLPGETKRPRILLITSSGPLDGDGASATTSEVWSALADCTVDVLCMRNRSSRPECYEPHSGERVCLHRDLLTNKFHENLSEAQRALPTVAAMAPSVDLVVVLHLSKAFFPSVWDTLDVPLVVFPLYTSHSYRHQGDIVPEEYVAAEKAVIRAAKQLITPSEFEAQHLLAMGTKAEKVVVRPRKVSFPARDCDHMEMPTGPFTLLSVGGIRRQKNHEDAIHALAALKNKGISARLRIVGPNQDRGYAAELHTLANSLDVTSEVEFVTATPTEMTTVFSSGHLALGISRNETFGRAIVEGVAHGVPTVIYDDLVAPLAVLDRSAGVVAVSRQRSELIREIVDRTAEDSETWLRRSRQASGSVRLNDQTTYLEDLRNIILSNAR